jgi:hypothetical protein
VDLFKRELDQDLMDLVYVPKEEGKVIAKIEKSSQ